MKNKATTASMGAFNLMVDHAATQTRQDGRPMLSIADFVL
jgi:hypothetical protein